MNLLDNLVQKGGQLSDQPGDPPVLYTLRMTPTSLQSVNKDLSMSTQMRNYSIYSENILPPGLDVNIYRHYAYTKMSKEVINRPLGLMFEIGQIVETCAINSDPTDQTTKKYIKIVGDANNEGMYEEYTGPITPATSIIPQNRTVDALIMLTTNVPTCTVSSGEPPPSPQPLPAPAPSQPRPAPAPSQPRPAPAPVVLVDRLDIHEIATLEAALKTFNKGITFPGPEPHPQPRPAPIPSPEPAPEPAPAPIVAQPQPRPEPAPAPIVAQPQPRPAPAPAPIVAQPQPRPAPIVAQPQPRPAPAPALIVAQPQPLPAPAPALIVAQPQPRPEPAPEPIVAQPQPRPAPIVAQPQPRPAPAPALIVAQPRPAPHPQPRPAPMPHPQPQPQPRPAPAPALIVAQPRPAPHPQPRPAPHPQPHPAPAPAAFDGYDVIVVAGQSNSVGRGGGASNGAQQLHTTYGGNIYQKDINEQNDSKIYAYKNTIGSADFFRNGGGDIETNPTESLDATETLLRPQAASNNRGFAMSFAREYIRSNKLAANRRILIINCGYGGTKFFLSGNPPYGTIYYWNYDINTNNSYSLYQRSLQRLKDAEDQPEIRTKNNRVVAILWHQGESQMDNTRSSDELITISGSPPRGSINGGPNVNSYKTKVNELLTNLKIQAKNIFKDTLSNTPILLGGLTAFQNLPNSGASNNDRLKLKRNAMNQIIQDICSTYGFTFVPSDNTLSTVTYNGRNIFNSYLETNSATDLEHFSGKAQVEFGKRYFYKYNNSISSALAGGSQPSKLISQNIVAMKQKGGKLKPLDRNYTDLYTNKELKDTIKEYKSSHTMTTDQRKAKFGSPEIMDTNTHQHMASLKDRLVTKIKLDYPDRFKNVDPSKVDIDIKYPPMPGKCDYTNSSGKIVTSTGPCPTDKLPDKYDPSTGQGDDTNQKAPLGGGSRIRSRYLKNTDSPKMVYTTRRSSRKSSTRYMRKNNVTMRCKKGGKKRDNKKYKSY